MADEHKSLPRAVRIYESLLGLYPRDHQREFGPLMVQFFRDQHREACQRGNGRALAALWLNTLLDVARSAVREQINQQTNRMKNTPPEKSTTSARPDELAKASGLMSGRDRRVAHIAFAIVATMYFLLSVGFLLNTLQSSPMTPREQWLGASASLLIPVILWSWRYLARFLPAISARRKRLALVALSSLIGIIGTVVLLRFIPTSVDGYRCPYPGTIVWAFLPAVIGISLLFGLEEAVYRKMAPPALS